MNLLDILLAYATIHSLGQDVMSKNKYKFTVLFVWVITTVLVAAQGFCQTQQQSDTMTLTTYYPAPYGEYQEIKIIPRDPLTPECPGRDGALYYNKTNNQMYICRNGLWVNFSQGSIQPSTYDCSSNGTRPNYALTAMGISFDATGKVVFPPGFTTCAAVSTGALTAQSKTCDDIYGANSGYVLKVFSIVNGTIQLQCEKFQ